MTPLEYWTNWAGLEFIDETSLSKLAQLIVKLQEKVENKLNSDLAMDKIMKVMNSKESLKKLSGELKRLKDSVSSNDGLKVEIKKRLNELTKSGIVSANEIQELAQDWNEISEEQIQEEVEKQMKVSGFEKVSEYKKTIAVTLIFIMSLGVYIGLNYDKLEQLSNQAKPATTQQQVADNLEYDKVQVEEDTTQKELTTPQTKSETEVQPKQETQQKVAKADQANDQTPKDSESGDSNQQDGQQPDGDGDGGESVAGGGTKEEEKDPEDMSLDELAAWGEDELDETLEESDQELKEADQELQKTDQELKEADQELEQKKKQLAQEKQETKSLEEWVENLKDKFFRLTAEDKNAKAEDKNAKAEAKNAKAEAKNAKAEAKNAKAEAKNAKTEAKNANILKNNFKRIEESGVLTLSMINKLEESNFKKYLDNNQYKKANEILLEIYQTAKGSSKWFQTIASAN